MLVPCIPNLVSCLSRDAQEAAKVQPVPATVDHDYDPSRLGLRGRVRVRVGKDLVEAGLDGENQIVGRHVDELPHLELQVVWGASWRAGGLQVVEMVVEVEELQEVRDRDVEGAGRRAVEIGSGVPNGVHQRAVGVRRRGQELVVELCTALGQLLGGRVRHRDQVDFNAVHVMCWQPVALCVAIREVVKERGWIVPLQKVVTEDFLLRGHGQLVAVRHCCDALLSLRR